jgi:nucleoside-diphosphate kinase
MVDKTLVLIKPDGVRRGLVGEVIARFEKRGLTIEALRLEQLSREKAEELYSIHQGKDFFNSLVEYVTSGPVVVMVVTGAGAVEVVRRTMGATNPAEAAPGTIRGDFALDLSENIVHGSDSRESALREIAIFFPEIVV